MKSSQKDLADNGNYRLIAGAFSASTLHLKVIFSPIELSTGTSYNQFGFIRGHPTD